MNDTFADPITAVIKHCRRSVGWKAYVMNLSFYMLFLLLLTSMTVLLDSEVMDTLWIDIPKYTIIVMCLFHLLKELFQIWDEVRYYYWKLITLLIIKINENYYIMIIYRI